MRFGWERLDGRLRGIDKAMRLGTLLLVGWLLIGALAAGQRHYFNGGNTNCAKAGTITVTILAGPLNYVGANPKVHCSLPQPSK